MAAKRWCRTGTFWAAFASLRGDWLPRLSEPDDRRGVAAVLLSLALVGAPLAGSLGSDCRQCPVECPMHQPVKAKRKPSCHAGGGSASHHGRGAETPGVGFSKPPCSPHGVVPGVALAPMILPSAAHSHFVPVTRGLAAAAPLAHVRNSEPPDTPPPIVFA
jgi:hypothetical protein